MADVEMKDSGAASSKGKAVAKTDGADAKKKFEVKKVLHNHLGGHARS
jgi:RING-box protein 1